MVARVPRPTAEQNVRTPPVHPLSLVARRPDGHRVELVGANLLRAFGAIVVIYAHIGFFFGDTLHVNWWLMTGVEKVLVDSGGLNKYLSFLGVAVFMMLTGMLLTGSMIRQHPGRFLANRVGRLLPGLWVAVALAVILIKTGFMGTFSGQTTITAAQAALSFVFGGFFIKPNDVEVLGVTWTLLVQIIFFVLCVGLGRPLLKRAPILVPIAGATLCMALQVYNRFVPDYFTVPMLSKVAATLPALFMGQIIYLAWTRSCGWVWLVVATVFQALVIRMSTSFGDYWAGDHYLWTMVVVTGIVLVVGRYGGRANEWASVHWLSSRSYGVYLLHTLILYRLYNYTEPYVGKTGAVLAFLVVLVAVVEVFHRLVEKPAGRWIGEKTKNIGAPRKVPAVVEAVSEPVDPEREPAPVRS